MMLAVGSYRADISNVLIVIALSAIPMAIGSYVLTYKPYRQFIFGLIKMVSSLLQLFLSQK